MDREKRRREGDVNKILRKVKKVEQDQLSRERANDDGQDLDTIFKALVSQRATCISESQVDPIEQSYLQLLDGLGYFHERYNVRTFIDEYLKLLQAIKKSEQVQKLVEALDGKWKVDQNLLTLKLSRK